MSDQMVLHVRLLVCYVTHERPTHHLSAKTGKFKKKIVECKNEEWWVFDVSKDPRFALSGQDARYVRHIKKIVGVEFDVGKGETDRWVKDTAFTILEINPETEPLTIDLLTNKVKESYESVMSFANKVADIAVQLESQKLEPTEEELVSKFKLKKLTVTPRAVQVQQLIKFTEARNNFVKRMNQHQRNLMIMGSFLNFDFEKFEEDTRIEEQKATEITLLLEKKEEEEETASSSDWGETYSESDEESQKLEEEQIESKEQIVKLPKSSFVGNEYVRKPTKLDINYISMVNEDDGDFEKSTRKLLQKTFDKFRSPTESRDLYSKEIDEAAALLSPCKLISVFKINEVFNDGNREDLNYLAQFLDDVSNFIDEAKDEMIGVVFASTITTLKQYERFQEIFKDLFKTRQRLIHAIVTIGYPIFDEKTQTNVYFTGNSLRDSIDKSHATLYNINVSKY
jgi:hypothetical protein